MVFVQEHINTIVWNAVPVQKNQKKMFSIWFNWQIINELKQKEKLGRKVEKEDKTKK